MSAVLRIGPANELAQQTGDPHGGYVFDLSGKPPHRREKPEVPTRECRQASPVKA